MSTPQSTPPISVDRYLYAGAMFTSKLFPANTYTVLPCPDDEPVIMVRITCGDIEKQRITECSRRVLENDFADGTITFLTKPSIKEDVLDLDDVLEDTLIDTMLDMLKLNLEASNGLITGLLSHSLTDEQLRELRRVREVLMDIPK